MLAASFASSNLGFACDEPMPNPLSGSVAVLDRELRFLMAKGRLLSGLGFPSEELLGKRVNEAFPPDLVDQILPFYSRAFGGEDVAFDLATSGRLLEVRATPADVDERGVSTILVIVGDVTSERRIAARLRFQAETAAILGKSLDIDETLSEVADLTVKHLADYCAIHVLTDDAQLERVAFATSNPDKATPVRELVDGYVLRRGIEHGPSRVIETGQTEILDEIDDDILVSIARDERQLALLREIGPAASLVVPMLIGDRVVGALTLAVSTPKWPFAKEDRILIEDLALRMAHAVENARTVRQLREERDLLQSTGIGDRRRFAAVDRLAESDVIAIAVIEGETITDANPAFVRILGYDPAEVQAGALTWWDLTPTSYRSQDVQSVAELLATGVSTPFEKEFVRRDGSRVPVLHGAALIERDPFKWVCFAIDLSARHELEQSHSAFNRELGAGPARPIVMTRWASQLLGARSWPGRSGAATLGVGAENHLGEALEGPMNGIDATLMLGGVETRAIRERARRLGRGKRRRLPELN